MTRQLDLFTPRRPVWLRVMLPGWVREADWLALEAARPSKRLR